MALITTAARSEILALVVGMFGAAPGNNYLNQLVSAWEAGQSVSSIANSLAKIPLFNQTYPAALTAAEFADRLVANLLGSEVTDAAAKTWATNWVVGRLNAGVSRGDVILTAVQALTVTTNPAYANAKLALANKVAVSEYYSVTKQISDNDLGDLQGVLTGITSDAASVTAAKDKIDDINSGQSYTLSTSLDTIVGGAGNNTIDGGTSNSWSAFDNIDGGAGNDTLIVLTALTAAPGGVTLKNVETLNINATGAGYTANTTGYTGLTALNFAGAAAGAVSLTAATTTGITATTTGASDIDVVGGGGVLLVATGAGTIQVGATAAPNAFTSASFSGGTTVEIHDNATSAMDNGTVLKTVSLNGNTGNVDISGKGVTAINATALVTAAAVITNTDLDTAHALTLTLNGIDDSADLAATGGTITFVDAEATSVAVVASGAASWDVTLSAAKATGLTIAADEKIQFDAITAGLATTVAITGDSNVVVSSHTLAATAAITSATTGNVTFTGALLAGQSYAGGAGVDTITLTASGTKAITTGAGNDSVTYAGALATGGSVDAGEGTDTLTMTAAQAVTATATTTFAGTVANFEVLRLSAATGAATAINMANADGINNLSIAGATVAALTVTNAAANFTLTQRALTSFASSIALASDVGTSDNVNLVYTAADGFTSSAAFTIANVEKLTITTTDADTTAQTAVIVTPLTATSAETVTVAGNMGISFIGGLTHTTLKTLDASGLTATGAFGGLTFTAGALANSSVIKGSAAGTNTVIFSAANTADTFVTYTGGTGADTITGSNGLNNVVTLGNGTNSFTSVGAGNNTITGGTGVDTITVGTGANTISVGAGNDIVHIGASAGLNTVDVGTGTDTIILDAVQTAAGYYTSVTGMGAGDVIDLSDVGGTGNGALGAKITLGAVANFANYLDAAVAGAGGGEINWFQFSGNTYITVDNDATATFADGVDTVIEVVGLIDLSASVLATGVLTG